MCTRKIGPIKDDRWIVSFAEHFRDRNERDYVMFMIGIYTGVSMREILELKVSDITKSHIILPSKAREQDRKMIMNPTLKKIIGEYIYGKKKKCLLFPSRHKTKTGKEKPVSMRQVHHILQKAGRDIGYQEKIGTYSLRKTFGYRYYQQYQDIETLKVILNHSTNAETMEFIGVSK